MIAHRRFLEWEQAGDFIRCDSDTAFVSVFAWPELQDSFENSAY